MNAILHYRLWQKFAGGGVRASRARPSYQTERGSRWPWCPALRLGRSGFRGAWARLLLGGARLTVRFLLVVVALYWLEDLRTFEPQLAFAERGRVRFQFVVL